LILENNSFPKVVKLALFIILSIFLCRVTQGYFAAVLAFLGFFWAITNKQDKAVACYMLFPFLVIMNPFILPKVGICGLALRLGPFAMTGALFLSGSRRKGRHTIPLGTISLYLVVASISSMDGYAPLISYLKIINFIVLIVGLWFGLKNMDYNPEGAINIRCFLLAMACVLIGGSLLTLFFPAIGYLTSVSHFAHQNPDVSMEELELIVKARGVRLFAGMSNHSQCLAVLMPCTLAWVACDMLFVERRVSLLHLGLLVCGMPLIYMTRSRIAFLAAAVATVLIYFWCLNRVQIPSKIKSAFRLGMSMMILMVIVFGIYKESTDQTVSQWLRKTHDVSSDQRSMGEAFTSSRMGLIEESMRDFDLNPLFGKGFQVAEYMEGWNEIRISAPIEKGVLPVMIIGETGIVGAIAFVIFLFSFYYGCVHKKLVITMSLFTVMLACNMAEASFFSPGGAGGILWIVCVAGGFVLDTLVKVRNRTEYLPM
jgi:hypothetical protein